MLFLIVPCGAQEFVAFAYHRFGDERYPSTNISLAAFRGQLQFLRDEGFTVLTLGEALTRFDRGTLEPSTAVLTVDDGYASFLTGAMPLLREFDMPATLFVSTDQVGGGDMLSWQDLAALAAEGIEIGNHTATHAHFLDAPPADRAHLFRADVSAAQEELTRRLGAAPMVFSYTYGEFDAEMRDIVRDLGFTAAVAQNSGIVSRHAPRFSLPRFPMGGPYATVDGFAAKARMRALPVVSEAPPSPVTDAEAPPVLRLRVLPAGLRLSGAQCFVAGQEACSLRVDETGDTASIFVQARRPLRGRRTLYTVTAPAASGGAWYWFSHVWVRPGVGP